MNDKKYTWNLSEAFFSLLPATRTCEKEYFREVENYEPEHFRMVGMLKPDDFQSFKKWFDYLYCRPDSYIENLGDGQRFREMNCSFSAYMLYRLRKVAENEHSNGDPDTSLLPDNTRSNYLLHRNSPLTPGPPYFNTDQIKE